MTIPVVYLLVKKKLLFEDQTFFITISSIIFKICSVSLTPNLLWKQAKWSPAFKKKYFANGSY